MAPLCELLSILFYIAATSTVYAGITRDSRIVNGEVAEEGQFPWQVGVISVKSGLLFYSGGAIISEEWILTAAHCIYEADSVIVLYGTLNLDDFNSNSTATNNFAIHDEYDNQTLKNDIGLVFLNKPLAFNDKVQSISLAEVELSVGTEVTVIGWGSTGDNDNSDKFDVLRYITELLANHTDLYSIKKKKIV